MQGPGGAAPVGGLELAHEVDVIHEYARDKRLCWQQITTMTIAVTLLAKKLHGCTWKGFNGSSYYG